MYYERRPDQTLQHGQDKSPEADRMLYEVNRCSYYGKEIYTSERAAAFVDDFYFTIFRHIPSYTFIKAQARGNMSIYAS
jgi:hypothetical protein